MTQREPGAGDKPAGDATADSGVDWEAVRQDFLHSGMSLRRIGHKHGTTESNVAKHRDGGGWERVAPLVRLPTRRLRPGDGLPPTPTQKRRTRIVARLYKLLDAKMNEIELRLAQSGGQPQSAAEAEREARSLNALARLYAKLVEMDATRARRATDKKTAQKTKDASNADRLRRDLAGRLARLKPGDD